MNSGIWKISGRKKGRGREEKEFVSSTCSHPAKIVRLSDSVLSALSRDGDFSLHKNRATLNKDRQLNSHACV